MTVPSKSSLSSARSEKTSQICFYCKRRSSVVLWGIVIAGHRKSGKDLFKVRAAAPGTPIKVCDKCTPRAKAMIYNLERKEQRKANKARTAMRAKMGDEAFFSADQVWYPT